MSFVNSIGVVFIMNAERLGEPQNKGQLKLSPLFYDEKHRDLKLLIENVLTMTVQAVQQRQSVNKNTDFETVALRKFVLSFRDRIDALQNNEIMTAYDQALMQIYNKQSIEEVTELLTAVNDNISEDDSNDQDMDQ